MGNYNAPLMVWFGARKVSLNSLSSRFRMQPRTVLARYNQIGKPKRVFAWLFAPSPEWRRRCEKKGMGEVVTVTDYKEKEEDSSPGWWERKHLAHVGMGKVKAEIKMGGDRCTSI